MIESDPDFYGAYWLQGAIHLSGGEFDSGGRAAARAPCRSAVIRWWWPTWRRPAAWRARPARRPPSSTSWWTAAAAIRAGHLPGARLQPARGHHDGD